MFEEGEKYNGPIPQIKYLPTHAIEHSGQAGEVHQVSDEVARNMDFSSPVEATAFRYGRNHDEFEPSVQLSDGHHRLAAAKQIGRTHLPVNLIARNAKGEKLNALKALSDEIENNLSKKSIGKADGGPVDQQSLTAYHGSPHDFDQFDTSKIGTGEGAQSFGHGLYFAQNEDVAKNYRDKLAGQDTYMIDHILEHAPELKNADRDTQMDLHKWAMNEKHDPYSAAKWAQAGNSRLREFDQNRIANVLASYRNASRGHMYEVGIKAHPNDFLDWDDYKANQSNKVHRAVSKLIEDKINKENPSNEDKYRYLSPTLKGREIYSLIHEDPQEASKLLHAHGIKGIKYLDELSRFKDDDDEDKTYNYVVFDDKDVHVRRKYAHGGDVERKHYEDGGGTDGGGGGGTDAGGFGAGVGGNDAGAQGMGSGDGPGGGGGGGDSGPAVPEAVAQQPEEKKPDPIAPKPLTPENMGLNLGYTGALKPTITGAMPTPYAEGGIVDAAMRKVNSKYSPEGLPLSAMEILSKIARTG